MHALLTPTLAIFGLGAPEILLILALFLLLFGAKRLPELARGFGKSIAEFKKASAEAERDIHQAINEPAKTTPPPAAKPGVNPPTGNN